MKSILKELALILSITVIASVNFACSTDTNTSSGAANETIAVTGITLNKTSMTLYAGESENLTATVSPSNATDKSVTWTSSNTGVATVDGNGKVKGIAAGSAVIIAASGSKSARCTVTVSNDRAFALTVTILSWTDPENLLSFDTESKTFVAKDQYVSYENH